MSKIDFYVLSGSGEPARQLFACRLAEKAYRLQNSVHIHVTDDASAHKIDDLLWTFRDGSFVPHEIIAAHTVTAAAPVTIGYDDLPAAECDLLINLGEATPDSLQTFPRVAEVVTSDEECRSRSRQRFVAYREQGHTLDTHNL